MVIFYNTLRVMGPAFKQAAVSKEKDDLESFGNADPEKESPADVASPASATVGQRDLPPKTPKTGFKSGFTPRKLTLLTPREASVHSFESTKGLMSARGHIATGSNASTLTAVSSITYKRSITPAAELNEMLKHRVTSDSDSSSDESSSSLPASRRERGKPRSLRRNNVPPPVFINPPTEHGFLTAVNLKTTAPKTQTKSRKSFLNMYGIRSAELSVAKHSRMAFGGDPTPTLTPKGLTSRPPMSAVAAGGARRPQTPSTSSTSSSPDVSGRLEPLMVLSPFMGEFIEQASQAVNSPLLEGHTRNQTDATPLAWEALVNSAANSPVAARSGAQIKASRRRSKSVDLRSNLKVPPSLHSASAAYARGQFSPARGLASPIRPLPSAPLRPGLPATPRSTKKSKKTVVKDSQVSRSNPTSLRNPEYFMAV